MAMFDMDILLGPLLATCLIGLTTFILFYWYSKKKLQYWKKLGVRSATSYPFVGSTYKQFTRTFQDVELERYKELGTIYGHYEGSRPLLSVAEPAILRDIFVKDFPFFSSRRDFAFGDEVVSKMLSVVNGEDWKRIRSIITPTFSTGKIKRMLNIFKDCSNTVIENLSNKGTVDAKRIFGAFTMDVIASSAFSTKLDSHNDPDNEFVKVARNVFTRAVNWRFILFVTAPWFMRIFKIQVFSPAAIDFFRSATLQIIEERQRTGQRRNDFLQLLIDTAKEVKDVKEDDSKQEGEKDEDLAANYGEDDTYHSMLKISSKKTLSMNELLAQCIIFFLAGYDTTASTLSFVSYNLALNPDAQEKVHQEVIDAILKNNGKLTYETIQEMKYLDNVISETLRLYPPATRLERQADADYKLGDTGITLKKGQIVTIPNYAMHRDPKLFPDPEKFEPNRFTPEERAKRDQYAYLPFGAGPRNCVGMRFALMEVKVCLVHVIANFEINRNPKTKVPLNFYVGQGLLQPKEILLDFVKRHDNPITS